MSLVHVHRCIPTIALACYLTQQPTLIVMACHAYVWAIKLQCTSADAQARLLELA